MKLFSSLRCVSVVVLCHNRRDALWNSIPRLSCLVDDYGVELILVDNASTDGSKELLEESVGGRTDVMTFFNPENLGVAAGRNLGWKASTREYILNIDDDTIVSVEAIDGMLTALLADPMIGVLSPRIIHARTGTAQLDYGDMQCSIGNFHGACHMVRKSLVETIGYNDESCNFGGEELDLSIRARSAGYDVVYTPLATVLHDNFPRSGQEGSERRSRWLYNFIRVHHKHFPFAAALLLSLRYATSHLVSTMRADGLAPVPRLLASALGGLRAGRQQHQCVASDVVQFYTNPELRPDLGNVPLLWKVRYRLTRE